MKEIILVFKGIQIFSFLLCKVNIKPNRDQLKAGI